MPVARRRHLGGEQVGRDLQVDRAASGAASARRDRRAAAARRAAASAECTDFDDRREHRRLAVGLVQDAAVLARAGAALDGMSVAMTRIGERDAHASPTAPSVFAAPGPVVVSATPSRPVARA